MERKTQQTSAAMAGMSVRSARKSQCGPLPSETGQGRWWRTRTDPFDGVWEEEIKPLLQGEAAGRLRATTIIEWLEEVVDAEQVTVNISQPSSWPHIWRVRYSPTWTE